MVGSGMGVPSGFATSMKRNPYLNRSMVREVGAFYGRQRETERVLVRIGAFPPQSVAITGERRIGKSSLLWRISQPEVYERYLDAPEQYVFVLLDFQGQQHLDVEGFCAVLGRHLRMASGARLEIPELHDLAGLDQVVRQMERAGLRLICLFDEFEAITRNPSFGAPFFGLLRSMANAHPVAFVTASRRDLQCLCHAGEIAESPFFNIFALVHLGPMLEGEVRSLICEPSASAGIPLAPHIDQIQALSGRLPFFVQIACSAAIECLAEGGTPLDPAALEARFLEEAMGHFGYLWERLDEKQRDVIQRVASGNDLEVEDQVVIHSLQREGYVERQGSQTRLFSRAFGRFLREAVPATEPRQPAPREQVTPTPPARCPSVRPDEFDRISSTPPGASPFPEIIGESAAIRRTFALMQRAIATDVTVLLTGETGTGKELVARTIHQHSRRKGMPFIAVNCGAIAEHLQESELFGHRKGAFTDAVADREGLFEAADRGALFLDEITETSASTQVKLLRVLQDGEIRRLGETATRKVDVRLICATNRDLEEDVAQRRFREDLYYRLYVLMLHMPALRERRGDIPLLIQNCLHGYGGGIDREATEVLSAYQWPGNIRELENQITSAMALAGGDRIGPQHLWTRVRTSCPAPLPEEVSATRLEAYLEAYGGLALKEARKRLERVLVKQRLEAHGWDLEAVASSLAISRSGLYDLIRRYSLARDE